LYATTLLNLLTYLLTTLLMHRPIGLSAYYLRDKKLLAC